MKATAELFWRWLRYQLARIVPDATDPVAVSRRSFHSRRDRIDRALARVDRAR